MCLCFSPRSAAPTARSWRRWCSAPSAWRTRAPASRCTSPAPLHSSCSPRSSYQRRPNACPQLTVRSAASPVLAMWVLVRCGHLRVAMQVWVTACRRAGPWTCRHRATGWTVWTCWTRTVGSRLSTLVAVFRVATVVAITATRQGVSFAARQPPSMVTVVGAVFKTYWPTYPDCLRRSR